MKAVQLTSVLRKRWRVIVVMVLVGLGLATGLTLTQQPIYTATSQLFVSTTGGASDGVSALQQGNSFAQQRVQSYIAAAKTDLVTQPASTALAKAGIAIGPRNLANKLEATAPNGKVIVNLAVSDPSPARAAAMANALASSFQTVVTQLEKVNGIQALKITVLQEAVAPGKPTSPNPYLNLGIGALGGLIVGLVLAVLREALDNTFKRPEQVADFSALPVLGMIPWDKQAAAQVVSFGGDSSHGRRAEAFRHLRTNLDFVNVDTDSAIIAVTSAVPGEGKTSTAINIAAALAEGGQRVCLVEADLRKPTMAAKLGLIRDVGLTSVLIGKAEMEDVLQNAGQNLAVMTSGEIPPNPSELLRSENFRSLLGEIASHVDRVVIDAAPLLPVADGAEVAAIVDEALLVVRAGKTTRDQLRRAQQTLTNVGVTPVGVILSMTSRKGADGYDYGDYYSYSTSAEPTSDKRSRRRFAGRDAEASEASEAGGVHAAPELTEAEARTAAVPAEDLPSIRDGEDADREIRTPSSR